VKKLAGCLGWFSCCYWNGRSTKTHSVINLLSQFIVHTSQVVDMSYVAIVGSQTHKQHRNYYLQIKTIHL